MKKLNFVLLLATLISVGGGKCYAHDIEVANADGVTIYYNFINDKIELEVTYKGDFSWNADYAGKVVIPESVTYDGNTYPVTTIGDWAFDCCSGLTELTIPNSVTTIGVGAFMTCTSLTELTIPNSVTTIGDGAFSHCSSLTELTIGNSVTTIGEVAFYECSCLIELTIPNSVTTIGDFAFSGCSGLTELAIPNSVTTIGEAAFSGCSRLEKITVENDNPNYDSREDCNAIIETDSNELIAGCKNTIIPGSVTSIGDYAFSGCNGLTEVTIPNSVTTIGDRAFYYCFGLTELTIPNSVTTIGENAFRRCSGLTELTIGNSVTTIGNFAFAECSSLTELTIPNSVTTIGDYAFSSCSGLRELTIPNSVTTIGNSAFEGCRGLTELTIGNSVTTIGRDAFYGCNSLTTLYSLNTTPPIARGDYGLSAFDDSHYTTVNLFVPEEALEAYRTADVWKEFQKLQAISGSAAVTEVSAAAEQIQTANGQITVTGLTDGTTVAVYDLGGRQVGTATSKGGQVSIGTGLTAGTAAVVKVGERSVKVTMK